MGKLHIDELRPGMKLGEDVRGLRNRKLFPAGTVIAEEQIATMKAWGVTEAEIEGVSRGTLPPPTPPEVPPAALEAARLVLEDAFQGSQQGNEFLEELFRLCTVRTGLRIYKGTFTPITEGQLARLRAQCSPLVDATPPPNSAGQKMGTSLPVGGAEQTVASAEALVACEIPLLSAPTVYLQVLREMESPACSARRMGEIVSRDPGLTAKILQLVNSPFYGFPSSIDSIERAITILGGNELSTLALGITAVESFAHVPSEILNMRHFWEHSISCGVFARLLAGGRPGLSEERFFVAGLLHDVGMLLLLRRLPQAQCRALLLARSHKISLHEAERQVHGFDHGEVGGCLLEAWGIPDTLVRLVRFHHEPLGHQPQPDLSLMYLADLMALSLRSDDYGAFYIGGVPSRLLEAVGLPPSALEPMLIQHQRQMDDMLRVFFGAA